MARGTHAISSITTHFGSGSSIQRAHFPAMGMEMAFDLSVALGICPPASVERVKRHFAAVGLPVALKQIANGKHFAADDLLRNMGKDKKVRDGRITQWKEYFDAGSFVAALRKASLLYHITAVDELNGIEAMRPSARL